MMQIMTCVAETSVGVIAMGEGKVARIGDGAALFSGLEGGTGGPLPTRSTLTDVRHGNNSAEESLHLSTS